MNKLNKIYINDIINEFGFKILFKSNNINEIYTTFININRLGLELAGIKIFERILDISYIGSKEKKYLDSLSDKEYKEIFKNIILLNPPLIILGPCFSNDQKILEVLEKSNLNVVLSDRSLSKFNLKYINFALEKLSQSKILHGSLCTIFGIGTLIIGESGVGKSEVIIELIKKSHIFVADDSIKVTKKGDDIVGEALELNYDFIEIRGLGILNFSRTFGIEKMIDNTKIEVVVELIKYDTKNVNFERFGLKTEYYNILGNNLIYYKIPVNYGRNISEIIETAITKYKLLKKGFDSSKLFLDKYKNIKK